MFSDPPLLEKSVEISRLSVWSDYLEGVILNNRKGRFEAQSKKQRVAMIL